MNGASLPLRAMPTQCRHHASEHVCGPFHCILFISSSCQLDARNQDQSVLIQAPSRSIGRVPAFASQARRASQDQPPSVCGRVDANIIRDPILGSDVFD
jgi:hypothetical protein